jgi:methionyl-tRNA formyltransferase
MSKLKVAVITSYRSWFRSYLDELLSSMKDNGFSVSHSFNHKELDPSGYNYVFVLSYFSIVEEAFLNQNPNTFVVHESKLPKGKGWAPLFWQILEGKNQIPIVLIQATKEMDAGDIFLEDTINLSGYELHDEIREKQAQKTIELCIRLLKAYDEIEPMPQKGEESFYPKRTPKDSELSLDQSIREQFNLLRIVNNQDFPAFFMLDGKKYVLTIQRSEE